MQEFDVLVVGGGASGLRAAIAARRAGAEVALISKVHPLRTNTGVAQGGLNAPLGHEDSPESFAEDTLLAGDGLCEPELVRALTREASEEVIWLEHVGVPFNRDPDGRLDRRRFGASSHNRTCYADDRTGHIVLQVLHEQFQRAQIASFEEWYLTSLAVDAGTCLGAIGLGLRGGKLEAFGARAIVLATGGFTRLYLPSTSSLGTTGDGASLAFHAGARLMDLEMIQFHPTVIAKHPGLLITEAVLGEGAEIVDAKGERIQGTKGIPREKICLSVQQAFQDGARPVCLDLRPIGKEKLLSRFPQTCELIRTVAGMDASKEAVPIHPAAHRPMGGIETSAQGETSIAGLFAVGECASSGVNGAGRLAGNTLTEAMVFGRRVGEAAARYAASTPKRSFPMARLSDEEKRLAALTSKEPSNDSSGKIHAELGKLMSEKVGLIRDQAGLRLALDRIQELKARYQKLRVANSSRIYNYQLTSHLEIGSLLCLAEIVALSAQARRESRGAHRRADFPARDDKNWQCHTLLSLVNGSPRLEQKPVRIPG
ncbi:MAG: FAD-binding protein [Deltaproteobacteria bacterium]|nr:FAD-binding protein [Deltaproteobacteria bacterium]